MPDKKTLERARRDKREGKSPSTQAGEFVKEEIEHIREGKHGARSAKQATACERRRGGGKAAPAKERQSLKKGAPRCNARLSGRPKRQQERLQQTRPCRR